MLRSTRLTWIRHAVAALAGGALCASAFAQEPPAEPAPAPAEGEPPPTIAVEQAPAGAPPAVPEDDTAQLEDVIVTATKREKSVRDIAGSVGEFNGERLENEGKTNLADFIEQKPGVTLTSLGPHLVKVNIRGIASDAYFGAPLPSPTGKFIGDTAFGDPFITNVQPDLSAFDLSRVEVLKGPQGTLFGGAALAGAIRYVLQEPVLGEWQARAFSQYDAPNEGDTALSWGAALNAPLGDTLAVRLGYVKRNYPGITDNSRTPRREDVDGSQGEQLRGIVSWRPLEALGIKYTHLEQDSFTANAIGFADTRDGPRENNKKVLPQPSIADFGMDNLEVSWDFDTVQLVGLASRTEKNWYIDVDISYVITGPPDPDEPFPTAAGTFQVTDDRSKSMSQELRLQSTDKDGLQWLVGLYNVDYEVFFEITDDTVGNRDLHRMLGTPPDAYRETTILYAVTDVEAYEKAAFFDLGYKFWDRLEVTAGARLYETQVKGGFFGTGALARQQNNGQSFDFSGNELTEKGVNPKFSATFEFTRELSAYVLASRGYRFGGLQTVPSDSESGLPLPVPAADTSNGVPPSYKSDTLWNYELGGRSSWLDNTLHLDATLFYIDYKDPQVVLRTNTATGLNLAYTDNIDHAVSKGVEAALAWLTPLDGVRLELSGGYTDSRITTPFNAPSPYTSSGSVVIPAGSRMPGVALYQYLAAVNYVAPQIGIFDLSGRVDYSFIGRGVGTLLQDKEINDYGTLNAGFNLTTNAWRFKPRLSFNVSNIRDVTAPKLGYAVKPVQNSEGPVDVWYLNAPRTYSLRLGFDF